MLFHICSVKIHPDASIAPPIWRHMTPHGARQPHYFYDSSVVSTPAYLSCSSEIVAWAKQGAITATTWGFIWTPSPHTLQHSTCRLTMDGEEGGNLEGIPPTRDWTWTMPFWEIDDEIHHSMTGNCKNLSRNLIQLFLIKQECHFLSAWPLSELIVIYGWSTGTSVNSA